VKQGTALPAWIGKSAGFVLLLGLPGWGQNASAPPAQPADALTAAVHDLQDQVRELRAAVAEVRSEAAQYRAETAELRNELQTTRSQLASSATPSQSNSSTGASSASANSKSSEAIAEGATVEDRVNALEETTQLLNSKLNDQYQTKIESASKYRVRLSGLVLLNIFDNRGNVDNQDFPTWVTPPSSYSSSGALGASLRQSELGLEVFGPQLAGARTSGNLQLDFSGGFPNTQNGVNYGLFRLRIASMRMDWAHTSVIAGQDNAFVSPLSPTSFASLAVPTFGYAGNLWGWIPQVRVEHRFDISDGHNITVQGGILDNLVGEPPYTNFNREAQAGERTGQPAYGTRIAWTHNLFGRPIALGAAGYYSRQDWGFNHHVDGWAGMTDWDIPIAPRLNLSGEFYRGTAVGGLGGGIGRSVLFGGVPGPATQIRALDSIGGWSQLKFRASSRLEFNGAFGLDNPYAEDLRAFSAPVSYFDPFLAQNRSGLVNFIYRPRSDLLFSAEYRHLRTFDIFGHSPTAEQVNLIMGVLF
jgi:hypothetical protein